jgi:hypothetical protein
METKLNIYQKLLEIQKKIVGLGKDKAALSYRYVTGDKVLEHVKPLMNEYGLLLKQEVLSIENVKVDYKTGINTPNEKPKSEMNSKVMMKFTWVDCATGDKDENLFGANGQNDWDKGVGSALTYAERYFLLKYFHIATDEDDIDNDQRKGVEPKIEPNTHFSNQSTPPSTTATELPPLDDKRFLAMLDAIAKGDKDKVKLAMAKYTLLKPQLDELTKLLN